MQRIKKLIVNYAFLFCFVFLASKVRQCFLDVLLENGEQWRRSTEAKKEVCSESLSFSHSLSPLSHLTRSWCPQLNMLTKIISRSEPSISMAGFFKLDKRTFASVRLSANQEQQGPEPNVSACG